MKCSPCRSPPTASREQALPRRACWDGAGHARFAPTSCCEDLTHLPALTLHWWGDRDAYAPPSSDRAWPAKCLRRPIITDAGHMRQVDGPTQSLTPLPST